MKLQFVFALVFLIVQSASAQVEIDTYGDQPNINLDNISTNEVTSVSSALAIGGTRDVSAEILPPFEVISELELAPTIIGGLGMHAGFETTWRARFTYDGDSDHIEI